MPRAGIGMASDRQQGRKRCPLRESSDIDPERHERCVRVVSSSEQGRLPCRCSPRNAPASAPTRSPRIARFAIDRDRHPLVVVGIRGYYRDSMGAPQVNDSIGAVWKRQVVPCLLPEA